MVELPIKMVIFHSYVSLAKGTANQNFNELFLQIYS